MILLSSFYLAPISYYAALFHAEYGRIEVHDTYRKQSYRNRCIIGGANGAHALSIPIVKPDRAQCKMQDIRIADHGQWQHLHWNAIVSAYNSSPFFQYYEDDFRPFYEKKFDFLLDFNEGLRGLVCKLLYIDTPIEFSSEYIKSPLPEILDLRESIDPKRPPVKTEWKEYYQVFTEKHGFISDLSIIDLLFNMGNESRLYLIENELYDHSSQTLRL